MPLLEPFIGLSPDIEDHNNKQENLGRFTNNIGQAKTELVENFAQTDLANDPETIDFAAAQEIVGDTIKVEKGKEAQEIIVNDTTYHISISPQQSPKDTTRGYILIENKETQQAKKIGTVTIDLNWFGRWFGGKKANEMDTKGTPANRIDSLHITDSTLILHGKMEIEREGKTIIEDYDITLNRNLFNQLLTEYFFGEEDRMLIVDVEKFLKENPKLYNTLAEKYGSIITSIAKKGITTINFSIEKPHKDDLAKNDNDQKSQTSDKNNLFQQITNKNE